jgi:hypothetical protein
VLCSNKDRGVALVGAYEKGSTSGGAVYTTVVQRVEHPDFDKKTKEYDFLVMKLGGWVSLSLTGFENFCWRPFVECQRSC